MTDELTGRVEVRVTGVGSKSEMRSVVLVTPDEEVVLRRRDALALDAEAELAAYDGKVVRVEGSRTWTTFVVDAISEVASGGAGSDLDQPQGGVGPAPDDLPDGG